MLETISTRNKLRLITDSGLRVEADVTKNPNGATIEGGTVYAEDTAIWLANFHRSPGSNWHYDFNPNSTREQREEAMAAAEDFMAEASENE